MNEKSTEPRGSAAIRSEREDKFLTPPSIYDRDEADDEPGHWFEPAPLAPLFDLAPQPGTDDEGAAWERAEQTLS